MVSCDTLCQKYNVKIPKKGTLKGQLTPKTPKTLKQKWIIHEF